MTSTCLLREWAETRPDDIAILTPRQSLTAAEWDREVASHVAALREAGVVAGMRVAIVIADPVTCLTDILALLRLQAVACPLSLRYPSARLEAVLASIGAKRLLSDTADMKGTVERLAPKRRSGAPDTAVTWDLERHATVLMSSGSTGEPKGVAHVLANHLSSARAAIAVNALHAGDRWMLTLPLYHAGGLAILFRCLLARAAILLPTNPRVFYRDIESLGATHLSLVPAQLWRWLAAPACGRSASLRCVLLGGAPASQHDVERACRDGIPVCRTYGMTEAASQVCAVRPDDAGASTSGGPLPGSEVRITGDGRIAVRGPMVSPGYVNGNQLIALQDAEGWFLTGDIGHLDPSGQLIVTGRLDHQFISGGENIQPEEIERELARIDGIQQAIVVPRDDTRYGQRPVAFVAVCDGADWNVLRWRRQLRARVAGFKIPDAFLPLPEMSEGALKRNRRELIELAAGARIDRSVDSTDDTTLTVKNRPERHHKA